MLKLKSSARESKRYLLIRGRKENIEKAVLDYIGILGWARAAPKFVKTEGKNNILAVNRKEIDKVRGAFALSADKIQVLKVSGTLKGLKKK
jgi:RNase P/RNase MRP subunit POP5